jgi:hypothetical protein
MRILKNKNIMVLLRVTIYNITRQKEGIKFGIVKDIEMLIEILFL